MKNGDMTGALIGVTVASVIVGGLVWWGHARKVEREKMAKDDPTIDPVGFFPGLRVGDVVVVDTALARLPAPFSSAAKVPCQVDMVLQDPAVISVKCPPGIPIPGAPFFSGTIPRSAILNVLSPPPFQPPISLEV